MEKVEFSFYSDIGGRKNNEDAYLAKRLEQGYLFVVADGLGGHDDGELASRAAVDAVKEFVLKAGDLEEAIHYANNVINKMQKKFNSKMETTIAAAFLTEKEIKFANVGDSRIYAFKNGEIIFQSLDHSVSQLAVAAGEITRDEIRQHPDRNALVRALGAAEDVKVDFTVLNSEDCDAVLLCTDGFWEYVYEAEMQALVSDNSAKQWLMGMQRLQLDRAPENGDNNTAVVIKKLRT